MSLATRCTTCGTIFRVVQDQLKVSEGWVRCGRCQEVFNALQNLFDLEREAPPPWPRAPAPADAEWDSTQQPDAERDTPAELTDEPPDPAGLATQPLLHTPSRDSFEPASDDDDTEDESDFADARFNLALLDEESGGTASAALAALQAPAPAPKPASPPAPQFVRLAEREARWQQPRVRAGMAVLLVLASLLLAGQIGVQLRPQLTAEWPALRAVLDPLCHAVGCHVEPPRRLDSLIVDSTGLTRLGPPGTYRLSVVLHNRSSVPVLLPAIELSLTDSQGQLVSRKAFTAAQLGAPQASIPGGAELPLQAALSTGPHPIVGYTVEIFYP
ncbi:zinc-ribbon and DUF3426 domain-containing protein [Ideonella sp. BN130291]|uniref:zinc-ribbon and DUF3426 domain-containing protein n=1 Tax=Ideonella sp. BN130291 TaxID=3112940 RepID=UPI002E26A7EF|nr:zinc-ribbon and DUF3426 domain-containing protein [Ideonella sp. BN130291]